MRREYKKVLCLGALLALLLTGCKENAALMGEERGQAQGQSRKRQSGPLLQIAVNAEDR